MEVFWPLENAYHPDIVGEEQEENHFVVYDDSVPEMVTFAKNFGALSQVQILSLKSLLTSSLLLRSEVSQIYRYNQ